MYSFKRMFDASCAIIVLAYLLTEYGCVCCSVFTSVCCIIPVYVYTRVRSHLCICVPRFA